MSKVRILPEILSNKIAAGEVVERPASAVKELVENSIDAGSTIITIEIENGGKSLIRISDNGSGMGTDDALLAIERYATSKIYDDNDLFSIKTLGFRGEALPSIASVSRFTLVTREKSADSATQIIIEGGKVKKVNETGAPPGTMISIEQLFFNTPARRKFLKTTNTEMGHISDTVASIALGWPHIQFRLTHNGKLVKSWPQSASPFHRAVDVLGNDLRNSFHKIDFEDGYLTLNGLISSPDVSRSTSQKIFLFINGRYIRDRRLIHALIDGYGSRLMRGRFPVAVLFLDIPFDQLDVNVHPTKHEVRFADHNRVYNALKFSVSRCLAETEKNKWISSKQDVSYSTSLKTPTHEPEAHTTYTPSENSGFPLPIHKSNDLSIREKNKDTFKTVTSHPEKHHDDFKPVISERFINTSSPGSDSEKNTAQDTLWNNRFFQDLVIVGQLHNTYILCDSGDGLIIIDQHAAHERIVFEELKNKKIKIASQSLLIPETIELGYKEAEALEKILTELAELGLEIEPFGGNTFTIKSVPAIISEGMIVSLVIEIAEKLVEIGHTKVLEEALDDCLILMSCHGAIRANQALTPPQIKHLLKQLDECETPSFCPHGRPTWTQWSRKNLEKSFKR